MESLVFYDYATAVPITDLDLGTVAPSSSADSALRVGNTSDSYQASDVTVTILGPDASQLYLSLDGDIFASSIEVGDIPPGSVSGPFWMRRITASSDPEGPCEAGLSAIPLAWTNSVDTSSSESVPLSTPDNPADDDV